MPYGMGMLLDRLDGCTYMWIWISISMLLHVYGYGVILYASMDIWAMHGL